MAKLTTTEIAARLQAAKAEGREPMHVRQNVKPIPAISRLNAVLERRARGH